MSPGTDVRTLRLHERYDEGRGPLIVLLHGLNADAREWRPVVDAIGPAYHCIAFDLLGYGGSPQPLDIDYTADEHATALENTLRDLGIHEPFVLVGYSLGGDIAVRYASRWPQRLRRLVLVSAPFYLPPEYYRPRGFPVQLIQAWVARWAWAFLARGQRDSTRFYAMASGRFRDITEQLMQTNDLPVGWEIMSRNLVNCISRATFVDDVPRLSMPTVFILGIRDPIVRPDQTLALRRLKPDLVIRRIVDMAADHMLLHALPERVGREILRDEIGHLHVAWRGGGGEPLAILAGQEGAAAWRPVAQCLAARFDVALIDLLGFGESPAPLTVRYDLADHVAALRGTLNALWPAGEKVHAVGYSLGATVVLGCAARVPERIAGVTAFSPACLAPDRGTGELSRDAAAALAAAEEIEALARDERDRGFVGEALERRLVPLFRSLRATALATNAAALLVTISAPVRLVLPAGDTEAPRGWARALAAAGRLSLSEPDGPRDVVLRQPAVAVAEVAPQLADRAQALAPGTGRRAIARTPRDIVRSVEQRFVAHGVLALALGLLLLSPVPIAPVWVARGFALWVAWSAASTVRAAFGVRRDGNLAWAMWAVGGGLGAGLALFMLLDERHAVSLFGFLIVVWLLWRAFADLFVAWRVPATPAPRWTLWGQGALALGAAVVGIIWPDAGGRILRFVLSAYFAGSGLMLIGYAVQSRRRASRRIHELLAESRRWAAAPQT